jgi:SAM-dependent methyltransferase
MHADRRSLVLKRLLHDLVARPAVYDAVQRALGASLVHRRLAALERTRHPTGWTLDLGGGTGRLAALSGDATRYVCLDMDIARLRRFRQRQVPGHAIVADATELPIASGAIDTVLCTSVTHHLEDDRLAALVRESRRVLGPDGRLVLLDPVWAPRRWIGRVLWRYDLGSHPRTSETLRRSIEVHFDLVRWKEFAVLHRYVIAIGIPRPLGPSRATSTDTP